MNQIPHSKNQNLLRQVLLSFRPKTLTAAIVPCIAATALVNAYGITPDYQVFWLALASAIFIQIGTNLVNDAYDFMKGADTKERIGPQRITQSGILSFKQVLLLAAGFFFLAIVCGIPLVLKGGWLLVIIGLISVLMGYCYTAGPFPIAYLGLGELFVILFFGIVAVTTLFYLHTGFWSISSLILGIQIGLHATVLIAINNYRDRETDIKANKKTLAVRWGDTFSKWEIAFLCISPFLLNLYWLKTSNIAAAGLSSASLPLAIHISKNIFNSRPSSLFNKFLGQSALLHLIFGLLISLGFYLK